MNERFITQGKPPTGHQRELMDIMVEECAEIIRECVDLQQRLVKAMRFGMDEVQAGQAEDNVTRIGVEAGELLHVIDRAQRAGVVRQADLEAGIIRKIERLDRYMQTSPENAA